MQQKKRAFYPGSYRVILRGFWVLSIGTVVFVSLKPTPELPTTVAHQDKLFHFLAYFWLGLLPVFAFARKVTTLVCAMSVCVLGGVLELLQLEIEGRFFSGFDILANTAGVLVGAVAGRMFAARYALHPEKRSRL